MLFLLRLGFWITLICLLLPGSREDNRRLISSAELTVKDMRGFCQRNPQVCDDVRMTMTTLFARFRSGAELIQTWLTQHDRVDEDHPASFPERLSPQTSRKPVQPVHQPVTKWQDSLNPSDKQMPWRGPAGF